MTKKEATEWLTEAIEQGHNDAETLLKEGAYGAAIKAGLKTVKPFAKKILKGAGKLALKGVKTPKLGRKAVRQIGGRVVGAGLAGAVAGRVTKRRR